LYSNPFPQIPESQLTLSIIHFPVIPKKITLPGISTRSRHIMVDADDAPVYPERTNFRMDISSCVLSRAVAYTFAPASILQIRCLSMQSFDAAPRLADSPVAGRASNLSLIAFDRLCQPGL